MARQAQRAKAAGAGGGSSMKIGSILVMLPVIGLLLPTCIVLLIMMVPTVVAYMVDRTREKYLAITIGLINFCGALPAVAELWSEGQRYEVALAITTDPMSWLIAYGAAAVGWMVYGGLPPVLANYYAITSDARLQSLLRQQEKLVRNWGEEVASDNSVDKSKK